MNIKYLEHLVIYPGSVFISDHGKCDSNIFKIILSCDNYFDIINPIAMNYMPLYSGSIYNSKDYLSKFAFCRRIELSQDKSAIDFESFSLEVPGGSIEFVYDYSFMYDQTLIDITSMSEVVSNNGEKFIAYIYPIAAPNECIRCLDRSEYLNHEYVYDNNVYAHFYLDSQTKDGVDNIPMYKLYPYYDKKEE